APPLATDWISQLSVHYDLQVDLLAAHLEEVSGQLAGRMQIAVRFNQRPLNPQVLIDALAVMGIRAQIIAERPRLQEAG
ncbi:MAG TPA: methionine ABC transporter ATP-binding protein, partial [Erwinia persicina]|nr:methionine ABC transporter ATP-binding protein [Erwinia persicina]